MFKGLYTYLKGAQSLSGSVYKEDIYVNFIATERTPPKTDTSSLVFNLDNLKIIVVNSDLDFFTAILNYIFHII